jgi:hypothetical protein
MALPQLRTRHRLADEGRDVNEPRTNLRRHGPDLTISAKDLITGRDARAIAEQSWAKFRPVIELMIDEAIRQERERAWWRRALRWIARKR